MMQVPLFFVSIITSSSLMIFNIGINGMYVNRTFLNLPLSLLDSNVIEETKEGEDVTSSKYYYFNKDTLNEDVKTYLSMNLKNKVKSYKISFKYFNYVDNKVIDDENKPNAIQIHFISTYYMNFKVDSHLSFYINNGVIINE